MIKAGSHFISGIYFLSLAIRVNSLITYLCKLIIFPDIYLYFMSDCLFDMNFLFFMSDYNYIAMDLKNIKQTNFSVY